MIFTDTHAHVYSSQFADDLDKVMNRALNDSVNLIFLPNIDSESITPMHDVCARYPKNCFPMMGLHPCHVKENYKEELAIVKKHLNDERKYYAVGEIGIDLHWDKSTLAIQQEAFRIQINWAKELGLPIVIHARESFDEIFEIVDELNDDKLTGVFHCFTGSKAQAEHILSYGGFKMGLGGVLTFKNSPLPEAIKDISLEHFVLETDSPYLAPTPFRGKRNEPSYVLQVAIKMAEIFDKPITEIARITTQNAKDLYQFDG
jgi:TatD DNase family protein